MYLLSTRARKHSITIERWHFFPLDWDILILTFPTNSKLFLWDFMDTQMDAKMGHVRLIVGTLDVKGFSGLPPWSKWINFLR